MSRVVLDHSQVGVTCWVLEDPRGPATPLTQSKTPAQIHCFMGLNMSVTDVFLLKPLFRTPGGFAAQNSRRSLSVHLGHGIHRAGARVTVPLQLRQGEDSEDVCKVPQQKTNPRGSGEQGGSDSSVPEIAGTSPPKNHVGKVSS